MSPKDHKKLTDTDERLEAVGEAAGTAAAKHVLAGISSPRPSESSEKIKTASADVANAAINEHALDCMKPGGGLFMVTAKFDRLNRSVLLATGAVMLVVVLIPIFGIMLNRRMQVLDDLQVQVAKMTAQHVAVSK